MNRGKKVVGILVAILAISTLLWGEREIVIAPSELDHFLVQAPQGAIAGEGFTLTITAQDAFDNVITDYALSGKGVSISTDGVGKVSPDKLLP